MPKPGPFPFNDYALLFMGPTSDPYFLFPRATTLLPYALSCLFLQLNLLRRNNIQRDLGKYPMYVYDQMKTCHLSRLSLININHNTNKMSTKGKKWSWVFM